MRPKRAGEYPATGDFGDLLARAIEAFGFYGFSQTSLARVHPEKQGVQLWGMLRYLLTP
jgi:hypothetical protein